MCVWYYQGGSWRYQTHVRLVLPGRFLALSDACASGTTREAPGAIRRMCVWYYQGGPWRYQTHVRLVLPAGLLALSDACASGVAGDHLRGLK